MSPKDIKINKLRVYVFRTGDDYWNAQIVHSNLIYFFKKLSKNKNKNDRQLISPLDPKEYRAKFTTKQSAINAIRRFYPNKYIKCIDD